MFVVRAAIDLDIIQISMLGKTYIEEAAKWNKLRFNIDKALLNALLAIEDPNQQIFVASLNGKLVGFNWVAVEEHAWSDDLMGRNLLFYVLPKHRNLYIAKELMTAFEKWAIACGAKALHVGAHSGIHDDRAASALYHRLGYKPGGANFYKIFDKEE